MDGREVAESGEEGDDSWSESSVQSDFGLEFGDSDLTFGSLLVDVLLLPSEERGRRGVSFKGRGRRKEMVELTFKSEGATRGNQQESGDVAF